MQNPRNVSHDTDFSSSLQIQIQQSMWLDDQRGRRDLLANRPDCVTARFEYEMQQMKISSFKCAWVLFELDGFCATGIDDQRARNLPSVLYSHQLPYHIPSRPDLKVQCQRNFPTIWGYCYSWSSPIQGNRIALQVHWHNTVTLSWLVIFLQLLFIEAQMST